MMPETMPMAAATLNWKQVSGQQEGAGEGTSGRRKSHKDVQWLHGQSVSLRCLA